MTKLQQVLQVHKELCTDAYNLVEKKGLDYNRSQQLHDTLFNMKVAQKLGIVETNTQSVLVRLSDKLMRLISLTKDPTVEAAVKTESVRDTVIDLINYGIYVYVMWDEMRGRLSDMNDMVEMVRLRNQPILVGDME